MTSSAGQALCIKGGVPVLTEYYTDSKEEIHRMKTRKVLGFALSLLMLVQVFAGLGILPASAESNLTATVVPMTASNVLIADNGATNLMTSTAQLGVSGGALQVSVSKYFDGTVPGVTTTDPNWGDWNGLGANTDYYLWYDFGSATELNVIELGGINGHSGFPTYTLPAFSLYATNDLDALKAGTLTPVASVTAEEAAAAKGFVAVLSETVSVRYVAVKIRSYSHVGKSSECWISEFGAANLTAAMKNAFAFGGSLTGDSQQTVYVPVTDKTQLPETNLLIGQIPTRADGTRPNTGNGTKLANLTDGGVQGMDQTVDYRLTEYAMSKNGTGSYYNWIAPTELVELLGYDTGKTWYIQDNNDRWWGSNVNETASTLYNNDAKLVYDLGGPALVEQLFIASSTEIGDGPTNGNTTGPNAPCSWDVVQAQMATTYPNRYALACHVYVGDTRDVFTEGTEVMSFDWQASADRAKALRNLFVLSKAVEGRYVGFDFTDGTVDSLIRLSELGVYGVSTAKATGYPVTSANADKALAVEDNVFSNAAGIYKAIDVSGAAVLGAGLTRKYNDGVMGGINATHGPDGDICDPPMSGSASVADNEWMFLTVDMGKRYAFNSFLFAGSGTGNYGVYGFQLFVNDTPLSSMAGAADREALYIYDGTVQDGHRVDFIEPVTGRYVHMLCKMRNNAGNYQMWVSELMATGVCVEKATGYAVNTGNADKAIALADNVLTKATGITWAADSAGATAASPKHGNCFDGVMCGINAEFSASVCDDPIGTAEYMMLTVDMGAPYSFDSFMLVGSGTGNYGVEGFSLFINDTPLTSMVGAANRTALYTCDSNVTNGYRVDLLESVTGQYVHVLCRLKKNAGNWQMWISELAAAGAAVDTRTERKVVTVGDSITEGIHFPNLDNWSTAVFENRYSDVLVNMLNETDETYRYTLYNAGISGAATVGAERVGNVDSGLDWLNHSRKPEKIQYCDVLTIMLGTNDAPNWSVRKDLYKECYTAIVNAYRALNPNLQLYVLTSPYTTNTGYAALEREIVPLQKELAQELGGTLIDVYKNTKIYTLSHETTDFLDAIDVAKGLSVHPGENGHKVIAEIVYAGMTNTAIPSYITAHTCQYTETVTKEATCGEEGVKTLTCSLCGDTRTESIPATGKHTYDEGVVTKEATCTEPGEKTFTCTVCGDTTTESIQALDHDWSAEWTVDVEATIVSEGSQSHHCNRCDEKRDVTPIPKKTPASTGWYTDETTGLTYYVHDDSSVNENTRIQIGSQYYNFYPADSVVDGKNVSYSLLQGWMKMPNGTTRYYAEGEYWHKTGLKKVDGKYYFFDNSTGALYLPDAATVTNGVGWYRSGTVYYALDAQTGAWIYGLYTDGNGDTYYYNKYSATSSYATGFVTVDGEELYFGADGKLVTDENVIPKNGWFTDEISGKTYYFKDGVKNTASRLSIDGQWVNFDEDGARLLGWVTMSNGITRYYGDGEYWYKTGFKKVDGKFYFFNATSGALYIPSNTEYGVGWYRSGSVYYALDPETGAWIHGLYTDRNGDTYYFPKYATTQGYYVGTVTVGGVEYTFGEDGKLVP